MAADCDYNGALAMQEDRNRECDSSKDQCADNQLANGASNGRELFSFRQFHSLSSYRFNVGSP